MANGTCVCAAKVVRDPAICLPAGRAFQGCARPLEASDQSTQREGRMNMYRERYGQWSGNERGREPDRSRCCVDVYSGGSMISSQCSRKNGYGPEGAYCKQHDPAEVEHRRIVSNYKYRLDNHNRTMRRLASVLPVIKAIAEGHNDPRALCQEWLDERREILTPPTAPKGRGE